MLLQVRNLLKLLEQDLCISGNEACKLMCISDVLNCENFGPVVTKMKKQQRQM